MCELFIKVDQVVDFDVAVVFFQQRILSQLVSASLISIKSFTSTATSFGAYR